MTRFYSQVVSIGIALSLTGAFYLGSRYGQRVVDEYKTAGATIDRIEKAGGLEITMEPDGSVMVWEFSPTGDEKRLWGYFEYDHEYRRTWVPERGIPVEYRWNESYNKEWGAGGEHSIITE